MSWKRWGPRGSRTHSSEKQALAGGSGISELKLSASDGKYANWIQLLFQERTAAAGVKKPQH